MRTSGECVPTGISILAVPVGIIDTVLPGTKKKGEPAVAAMKTVARNTTERTKALTVKVSPELYRRSHHAIDRAIRQHLAHHVLEPTDYLHVDGVSRVNHAILVLSPPSVTGVPERLP